MSAPNLGKYKHLSREELCDSLSNREMGISKVSNLLEKKTLEVMYLKRKIKFLKKFLNKLSYESQRIAGIECFEDVKGSLFSHTVRKEQKKSYEKELSSNKALRMVNYEGVIKGMHKAKIEVKT